MEVVGGQCTVCGVSPFTLLPLAISHFLWHPTQPNLEFRFVVESGPPDLAHRKFFQSFLPPRKFVFIVNLERASSQHQSIWYHDGQNGRLSVFEGYQNIEDTNSLVHVGNGGQRKTAVTVIYCHAQQWPTTSS